MKKVLTLFLAALMVCSLAACGEKKTASDDTTTTTTQAENDSAETTTGNATTTVTVADPTTTTTTTTTAKPSSTTAKPTTSTAAKPVTLNPKQEFKFGKYKTTYFSADKGKYYEISLEFFADFDGLEYCKQTYYTKAAAEAYFAGMGMTFTEDDAEYTITKNGTVYYNLGFAFTSILPESYKLTDTVIKTTPDIDNYGTFELHANGTLVLVSSDEKDRYGAIGAVYTLQK